MATVKRRTTQANPDGASYGWASKTPSYPLATDVDALTPCAIGEDSTIRKATSLNDFAGISPKAGKAGENMTLLGNGVRFPYCDSDLLTPGNLYYISETPGEIDDAPTLADTFGAFRALTKRHLVARTC